MFIKIKNKINNLDYTDLYFIIAIILCIGFIITNIMLKSNLFSYLTQHDVDGNDFFFVVYSTSNRTNLYNLGAFYTYPALAFTYYYFLFRLLGVGVSELPFDKPGVETLYKMYTGQDAILVYLLYNFIILILLFVLVFLFLNKKTFGKKIGITLLILFSWPFLFNSIKSGNLSAYASIISAIGIYFWYMNSNKVSINSKVNTNKLYEYIPLILISIAAGFKIFPCIYGLLYIKDRDMRNTIRILIIGAIIMFLPFAFFGGGSAIKNFFDYIFNRNGWLFGEISIGGYVVTFAEKLFLNLSISDKEFIFHISRHIFLLICLIFFFLAKKKWQSVLCLTSIICSYFPAAYSYNLTYLIAPFLLFLMENDTKIIYKRSIIDNLIFMFFSLIFTIPFYMYFVPGINHIYAKMFLFVVLPLYIFNFISIIYDNVSRKPYKKN